MSTRTSHASSFEAPTGMDFGDRAAFRNVSCTRSRASSVLGASPPRQAVETLVMEIEQGCQSLDRVAGQDDRKGTGHELSVHILLNGSRTPFCWSRSPPTLRLIVGLCFLRVYFA